MYKNLLFCLIIVFLTSCDKETLFDFNKKSKEDARINYFFTTSKDSSFDQISFTFDYARAHRSQLNQIRTVYLDQSPLNFYLKNPEKIYLGSSTIEAETITGYDLTISSFKLRKGSEIFKLGQIEVTFYKDFELLPKEGEELDIIFFLDLANTITLDSAGRNWIKPKVEILK